MPDWPSALPPGGYRHPGLGAQPVADEGQGPVTPPRDGSPAPPEALGHPAPSRATSTGASPSRPPSPGSQPDASSSAASVPGTAVWWALLGFVVANLVAGVTGAIGAGLTGNKTKSVLSLFEEPGLWAALAVTAVLVSRQLGTRSLAKDFGLRFKPVDLAWGACAACVVVVVAYGVAAAFSGTRFAGSNTEILTQEQGKGAYYVAAVVVVAVGAPFFEELFFRGLLQTSLRSWLGQGGAVVGQAVLFGLAHYGEVKGTANVSIVLAMTGAGLVLGTTAKLTGRLGAGMVAHCLFNLVAVVSLA